MEINGNGNKWKWKWNAPIKNITFIQYPLKKYISNTTKALIKQKQYIQKTEKVEFSK